jgi:hypothetical protein
MNLYSTKQRWKIFLLALATVIVAITLWYSNHIAERIRAEERQKVELWSEAIKRRAELVVFTQKLFEELKTEERKRVDLLGNAYYIINDPPENMDFTFILDFISNNTTIPVLIYDDKGNLTASANLESLPDDKSYVDSLLAAAKSKNDPIVLAEVGRINNVQVTEQELAEAMRAEAMRYGPQAQQIFDFLRQNPSAQSQIRAPIFEEKVVDLIVSRAKVEDEKVSKEDLLREDDMPSAYKG